jgi:DNA-binding PadR family transcriptional regulator
MTRSTLGALELTVLLAVARLGDEAFGLAVRSDVSERTGHDYSVGAIYTTLQRLENKALVKSRSTEPTARRGGRSRRQFHVTAAGRRALRDAQRVSASMWVGMGGILPEGA